MEVPTGTEPDRRIGLLNLLGESMSKTSSTLNTQNPHALIYKTKCTTGTLEITVNGGVKVDSFHHLKVSLKLKNSEGSLRQPVDLFNDDLVSKLVRKTAEKLSMPTAELYKVISDLTDELEAYRLKKYEEKKTKTPEKVNLTKVEEKKAVAFLSAPDLMERTLEDIGKSGVIGEEMNRLLMYICYTSRMRNKPLHVVCLGSSGSGKTHLQECVSALIPEEDRIEMTSLSEQSLYYYGKESLAGKLILIEDLDGAESSLYPLRELQSKQQISRTTPRKHPLTGELITETQTVKGPVATSGCTTREKMYEDNANRAFLIHLDDSEEQDERIMSYQRLKSMGNVDSAKENKLKSLIQNTQRVLSPITVRNPYADKLNIPHKVFKQRRTNELYLRLIESITFYHQFQRTEIVNEKTGETFIESTFEDIHWANRLISEVFLSKSDELSKAERAFFEKLKDYLKTNKNNSFYTKDLRIFLRLSPATVGRHVLSLEEHGYLKKVRGSQAKGFEYQVIIFNDYDLLKQHVYSCLETVLEQIKEETNERIS